jgi:hypothetical protein
MGRVLGRKWPLGGGGRSGVDYVIAPRNLVLSAQRRPTKEITYLKKKHKEKISIDNIACKVLFIYQSTCNIATSPAPSIDQNIEEQ